MLFQNLTIENATEPVDIRVSDRTFAAIAPKLEPRAGRK